eukprot:TRINITY_DN595_c0_g1_i2.p1 TRINITY_DN595_c0_g1~~TRINITY_DN595_c0_g1_i2.p1  ORF type:complete len:569 (-),score=61.86 TRINITY_DN595_c0_g1_i2:206-1690(-)
MEEVAKHTTKTDCWVVVSNQVLNVTNFLSSHPGGELAILTFAGRDATEEFNMIHPPDVIPKYAPDSVIGMIGAGSDSTGAVAGLPPGVKGYSLDEVSKHTSKNDCWVVVAGQVLDVTSFLPNHPGGELAIMTFAGKDATEEFNMIHPPDVIQKYAPEAIIGMVGDSAAIGTATSTVIAKPQGGKKERNWSLKHKNQQLRMQAEGKIHGCFGALVYMVLGFMKEIIFTIFGQKNIVLTNDRLGLTRSAMFLFVFIVIHAIGNLHVFLGPDDFNGYGYFYVRLYWTGFGLEANIVEEYVLLAALLHVFVALKRTWDISIQSTISSGKMNLAISGVALLTFMTIHLFQFRFGDTQLVPICPPKYLLDFTAILPGDHFLNLFWIALDKKADGSTDWSKCVDADGSPARTSVRDIYTMEFEVFKSFGWMLFYISSVTIFTTHMCLGWRKCVPAPSMGIPARFHNKAVHVGYVATAFIALVYVSFPVFAYMTTPEKSVYM